MTHKHPVYDTDIHFIIDPATRKIANNSGKLMLAQNDHNSERLTFEIPWVDGHDMSLCNSVQIHYLNIDSVNKLNTNEGIYEVQDLQAGSGETAKMAVFSWLISSMATQHVGLLSFAVRFACTDDNGKVVYAWHTLVHSSISVGESISNAAGIDQEYIDIIAQWENRLFGLGDTLEQQLMDVSAQQQAEIEARGELVKASIPDDYSALSALAHDNQKTKGAAIVNTAGGEVISVPDASNAPVQGLRIYGKTTQDGTPTPEAPVELVSVGASGVINTSVVGKNLCPAVKAGAYNGNTGAFLSQYPNDRCTEKIPIVKGQSYTQSNNLGMIPTNIFLWNADGTYIGKAPKETTYVSQYDGYIAFEYGENDVQWVQLELGDTATEYEPYKGQTLTAQTPNGLPGIPVASDGNYTYANGRQWICDEIDSAKSVYVQRIETAIAKGNDGWVKISDVSGGIRVTSKKLFVNKLKQFGSAISNVLCSHFPVGNKVPSVFQGGNTEPSFFVPFTTIDEWNNYLAQQYNAGTPVITMGVIKEPIETPLSAEELAQYAALHTNKPNTTVYNDAGAYMEMEYVADTKLYIDRKFAELAALLTPSAED